MTGRPRRQTQLEKVIGLTEQQYYDWILSCWHLDPYWRSSTKSIARAVSPETGIATHYDTICKIINERSAGWVAEYNRMARSINAPGAPEIVARPLPGTRPAPLLKPKPRPSQSTYRISSEART